MENSNRRRLTLLEQMSEVDDGRNNVTTLDAILGYPNSKRPERPPSQNRTLLDIIREDVNIKDKKSWKSFRDKLRLKRAGAAWTSSIHIPASDVNVHNKRSQFSNRGGSPASDQPVVNPRLQLARMPSVRMNNPVQNDHDDSVDVGTPSDSPPSTSFRPQTVRQYHSARINIPEDNDDDSSDNDSPEARDGSRQLGDVLAEERELSAREAVVAQEAAEAAAAGEEPPEGPVKMSLMDLLGESGSSYDMEDEEEGDYNEEEEDEEEEEEDVVAVESSGKMEYTCCVCMVRHKGSAFIPCGHTFCRLCSRELWVQRGNCPLCNGFILEILDIF